MFSGDAIQLDPGRDAPGWDEVVVESTRMWVGPLPEATAGFPKGSVPGENAIDTKVWAGPSEDPAAYRPRLVIRDVVAFGFRGGMITNMAAFNLKEKVRVELDRVRIYDSEIALRVRGAGGRPLGADVTVRNTLIYDVDTAIRYEDQLIYPLKIQNITIGDAVGQAFKAASVIGSNVVDARNVLVLGTALPSVRGTISGLAVSANAFVDVSKHDYRPAKGSPAIDSGELLVDVTTDLTGLPRPQGNGYDIGAFERRE